MSEELKKYLTKLLAGIVSGEYDADCDPDFVSVSVRNKKTGETLVITTRKCLNGEILFSPFFLGPHSYQPPICRDEDSIFADIFETCKTVALENFQEKNPESFSGTIAKLENFINNESITHARA